MRVTVEAIDTSRSIKAVPFLYLRKDTSLEAVPYGIILDRKETNGNPENIKGVKVVQKTLHSEESYQVFEVAKSGRDDSEFGFFALNTR